MARSPSKAKGAKGGKTKGAASSASSGRKGVNTDRPKRRKKRTETYGRFIHKVLKQGECTTVPTFNFCTKCVGIPGMIRA